VQTAIATVSLSGTLNEKLEAIAKAQFRGVEIFENDLLSFNGTPAEIRRMIEDLGLRTITFQPFRDFEGMPEPQRAKVFSRAERKFDVMQELGCDLLLVCSNVSPDALGGIDRAAADFRELGERASKRGLRVAFEALAWGRHINDYRDAWEVVRRADHPSIGLVLDTFHILVRGTDLRPIRAVPKDRIFLVQVADAPLLDMDYLSWSRHYRCFPGQGDLAVQPFMAAAPDHGFALADSAGDGGGALAVGCQNNDPRPPNVLLRAVAIANDRVQPNPILRSDSDGNSLAHHRHSHKTEPSETPIRTLLSGAIH
jgi:3-dehydroshikimate dehydratase